jgi:hypothetical protein
VLAAARYRGTIAKLNFEWERWAATIFDDAVRRGLIDTAASAERILFDDANCDIEKQLATYLAAVDGLQFLVDEMRERARQSADEKRRKELEAESRCQEEEARTWAIDKDPRQMSLDEILVLFSFVPGSRPTSSEVRNAFMRTAQLIQPRPEDANFAAKNLRYRQTIDAYKILRAAVSA